MIRPVAPLTTKKNAATYHCDGLTGNTLAGRGTDPPADDQHRHDREHQHERQRHRVAADEAQLGGQQPPAGGGGLGGHHAATFWSVGPSSRVRRASSRSGASTRRSRGIGPCCTSQEPTWAIVVRSPTTATWSPVRTTWTTPLRSRSVARSRA